MTGAPSSFFISIFTFAIMERRRKNAMKKLEGYRRYPGVGFIYDEDVYQFIRKHSRLIDRLNPRKMLEMTEWAYAELSGTIERTKELPANWKYYGRNKR